MESENFLRHKFENLIILRPTAVYGPYDYNTLLIYKFINLGFELYFNNKNQKLSLVHVNDLVRAIFLAIESKTRSGTFNISDGKCYTIESFYAEIRKNLGKKTLRLVLPGIILKLAAIVAEIKSKINGKASILSLDKTHELLAENWCCDISETKSNLGYEPSISMKEGLKSTLKWCKENEYIR